MESISKIVVRLESVTSFERVNEHVPTRDGSPYVEQFYAITMSGPDGTLYVNYTRQDTAFALHVCGKVTFVSIGSLMTVGFQVVEHRNDEYGPHYKVSRVQVGGYAAAMRQNRVSAKRQARLAKLGIYAQVQQILGN